VSTSKPDWLQTWGYDKIGATPPTQEEIISQVEKSIAEAPPPAKLGPTQEELSKAALEQAAKAKRDLDESDEGIEY